jgi:hypothetical protein
VLVAVVVLHTQAVAEQVVQEVAVLEVKETIHLRA